VESSKLLSLRSNSFPFDLLNIIFSKKEKKRKEKMKIFDGL
jgi:hypothetical protein